MPPKALPRQGLFPHQQVESHACFQHVARLCFLGTFSPSLTSSQGCQANSGTLFICVPSPGRTWQVSLGDHFTLNLMEGRVQFLVLNVWSRTMCVSGPIRDEGSSESLMRRISCPHPAPQPTTPSAYLREPDGAHILRSVVILGAWSLLHLAFQGAE